MSKKPSGMEQRIGASMNNLMFSALFTFENMTKSTRHPEVVEQNRIEAQEYIKSGEKLSFLAEDIRLFLGVPLIESSGFRGKTLTDVGGFSKSSTHMRFEALDAVPKGMSVDEAFNKILANKERFPNLRKVIIEKVGGKSWLHIEVKINENEKLSFYKTDDGKNFIRVA